MDVIAFQPDRGTRDPVYRQLARYLGSLVEAGRLRPGQKLPASRELAASLGLSRTTVNQAYQLLLDGELARAHVGQGTFVAERPAAVEPAPPAASGSPAPGPQASAPRAFAWEGLFSARARSMRIPAAAARELGGEARFDFRGGRVDAEGLPSAELRRLVARTLEEDLPALANHQDPRGLAPLRETLARRLVARGVLARPEEVVVVNGAQQALDLLTRLLLDPGDAVAMEDPGYFGARLAFNAAQAHAIPIPVDAEGLDTDALARVLRSRRLKFVYATPAVQCPTGVSLAAERRDALLALAEAHQLPVLEDDYDGELRLDDPAVPALKSRDAAGQVIAIGTFSKAAFPALRLGYVVAPPPLAERLAQAKAMTDFTTSPLLQSLALRWIESGGLDRHVRQSRARIAERIDAALEAIAVEMPEGSEARRPAGGNAVWLRLPGSVDPEALRARAREAEVAVANGGVFFDGFDREGRGRHLYLSVASLSPGDVREGIARLGECARTCRRAARRATGGGSR